MCLRLASEELSRCVSQAALIHQQKVAYKLVFEASCGTRATTVSPWGWALSVRTIKPELGGQLLWAEGRDPRSSQQPGRTTTQWAPHPHASQLRWSHVDLINTRWPCREQGEPHFLGLSFLVLACGVSVPSIACPLSGKNTEDGEEGKGSWLPLMAFTCNRDTDTELQAGTLALEGRRYPLPPPGSSSDLPPLVAVYWDRMPQRTGG